MKYDGQIARVAVAVLFLLSVACSAPEQEVATAPEDCLASWCSDGTKTQDAIALNTPVSLCSKRAQAIEGTFTTEVLIDSSGSMRGFSRETVIRPTFDWVRRAVQQLGAPPRRLSVVGGVWAFDEGIPARERPLQTDLSDYAVSDAHTNLDDAVADRASAADATIIITDGVPFVGGGMKKACAGTADPSCVANAIIAYLNKHSDSGMWIVPLLAQYAGPLDTEGQAIPSDDSYAARVTSALDRQFPNSKVELRVTDGKLQWNGPKMLVLFVLAKKQAFGRLLVWSLLARANDAQIPTLKAGVPWQEVVAQRGAYGVGVMTAIEVAPGMLPEISGLTASQVAFPPEREDVCGGTVTIAKDAFKSTAASATLSATCGPDAGLRSFDVKLHSASNQDCIQIYVLPKVKLSVVDETRAFVREPTICIPEQGDVAASIRVDITCPADASATHSVVSISGVTAFAGLDESIRSATPRSAGALGYLKGFTTASLPTEPWAVLGLPSLVEQIARGARQNTKADALATITVDRHVAQ